MTAYKQVVALLGKDPASLLQLLVKLLVEWKLDFQKFLHMLQNLKKEHIIGLMDGTHEVVKISSQKTSFNVWKTIKLGTLKNADEFRKALKKNGFRIGDWANDILGKPAFTISSTEEEIQLANVSVADLGFKNGATYGSICAKAKELGLELCPNEVVPQLRLQYKDQPKGEYLRIAMEPITDSDGDLNIFDVVHDDVDWWLNSNDGSSDHFWNARSRFVFRLRK